MAAWEGLQAINYPAAHRRAGELGAAIQELLRRSRTSRRKPIASLGQAEVRELYHAAHQCSTFEVLHYRFSECYHTLRAFHADARTVPYEELRAELSRESWCGQHEILARWGWIQTHKDAEFTDHPRRFICEPAKPDQSRFYKHDREFDAFINFLHGLRSHTGRELLFRRKREGPDFETEEKDGLVLGIEFCEAVPTQKAIERSAEAKVLRRLSGSGRSLAVEEPDSWESLRKAPNFQDWLAQAEIVEGVPGYLVVRGRGPKAAESEVSAAVRIHIQIMEKLTKPPPAIRPCILVVNPLFGPGVRCEVLFEELDRLPMPDLDSHFDEVWLGTDQMTQQVWP